MDELGKFGEDLAVNYLKKQKYKILFRNYRTVFGEMDIIAKKNNTVAFVEVKSRKTDKFGLPREAVGYFKQNKYFKLAHYYIKNNGIEGEKYRFDVVEVLADKVNHIENAYDAAKRF